MIRQQLLDDPAVHYFVKDVLRMTENKDPVDCLKDLEVVKQVIQEELKA